MSAAQKLESFDWTVRSIAFSNSLNNPSVGEIHLNIVTSDQQSTKQHIQLSLDKSSVSNLVESLKSAQERIQSISHSLKK